MKNNIIKENKITLETSFNKLNSIDFSSFNSADRAEIKEEIKEVIDLIMSAKKNLKKETV